MLFQAMMQSPQNMVWYYTMGIYMHVCMPSMRAKLMLLCYYVISGYAISHKKLILAGMHYIRWVRIYKLMCACMHVC